MSCLMTVVIPSDLILEQLWCLQTTIAQILVIRLDSAPCCPSRSFHSCISQIVDDMLEAFVFHQSSMITDLMMLIIMVAF